MVDVGIVQSNGRRCPARLERCMPVAGRRRCVVAGTCPEGTTNLSGLPSHQWLWPDGEHDVFDVLCRAARNGAESRGTDRLPDWQHVGLCPGCGLGIGPGWRGGGVISGGCGTGAGVSAASRFDGGALCGRPAWDGTRLAYVPHGGPGAVAYRWRSRVYGPG